MFYLVLGRFVRGHVTLQLCAVAEGVGTQRAGEALLVFLVPIFDVFLQRRQTFVSAVAVRTGEQLCEVIRCARHQVCRETEVKGQAMEKLVNVTGSSSRCVWLLLHYLSRKRQKKIKTLH